MNDKPENKIITSAKEALDIAKRDGNMHQIDFSKPSYLVLEDGSIVEENKPASDVCRRLDRAFRDGTFYSVVGIIPPKPPIK